MSSNKETNQDTVVQELIGIPAADQAEQIADQFSRVSNIYAPLKAEDINLENIHDDRALPEINPYLVYLKIMSVKKKTATVVGDIPMKVITFCAEELSFPLTEVYTRALLFGEYPNYYKLEIVTPAAKVYPPQSTKDLRKIAGTLNFSKIFVRNFTKILVKNESFLDNKNFRYPKMKTFEINFYFLKKIL